MEKYTLSEGYSSLNRSLLLMKYDLNKTSVENLNEETGAVTLQWKPRKEPLTSEEKHNYLMAISLVGVFIPFVGPAISIAADVADAMLYYKEGDMYGAGMAMAFNVLPFGMLIKKIPGIQKIGQSGLGNLVKSVSEKLKNNVPVEKFTEVEKNVVNWFNKEKNVISKELKKEINQKLKTSISKIFSKKLTKQFLIMILKKTLQASAKFGINIGSLALNIGGVMYSYDKLYKLLTNDNTENKRRIAELQRKLQELKYDIGKTGVDGIMGPSTKNAIMKFQKRNKMSPTGTFDNQIANLLKIDPPTNYDLSRIEQTLAKNPEEIKQQLESNTAKLVQYDPVKGAEILKQFGVE